MSKNICIDCKKEFKYPSYLKKHISGKKIKCIKKQSEEALKIAPMSNNNTEIPNLTTMTNSITTSNLLNANELTTIIANFMSLLTNAKSENATSFLNYIKNFKSEHQIDKTNQNNIGLTQNETQTEHIYECQNCNYKFTHRQSLHRHTKLGKCKPNIKQSSVDLLNNQINPLNQTRSLIDNSQMNRFSIDDILNFNNVEDSIIDNTNIDSSNNSTNIDNSNSNNNTNIDNSNTTNSNNTNTIINIRQTSINYVNPFGCETLNHISIQDFKSIFNNYNSIIQKLCEFIYINNQDNMNFYKNNKNKKFVSFLNSDLKINCIPENKFIKDLTTNIKELSIELFYMFRNELSIDELINYMKNLLMYERMAYDNKQISIDNKQTIETLMDMIFRNDEIKQTLKTIKDEMETNPELKTTSLNKIKFRLKTKALSLKDYKYIDENANNDKCLKNIKNKAELSNRRDYEKITNCKDDIQVDY